MRSRAVCVAIALALAACTGAPERDASRPVKAAGEPPFARTAATLAAGACAQLDGRTFSLASGADGVVDLFVLVKTCAAHAERDDVVLAVEAYAWLAVDRDLGAVSVREFVHVTLRVEARLGAMIAYRDDHAEVTLTARRGAKVAVEPVGLLEVEALNWASLLALHLAPSAGASAEAIAKRKLRDEAEAALLAALAQPIVIAYDGRTGATSFGGAGVVPGRAAAPMRVVPRGTALSRRLEPSSAASSVDVHVTAGEGVAVRAVCCSLAERLLDADRRGDAVGLDAFTVVAKDASVPVPPMPCKWTVAARAIGSGASLVSMEMPPAPPAPLATPRRDRWVAFDVVSAELHEDEQGPLTLEIASVAWRRTLTTKSPSAPQTLVVLSPDEAVWARARRPGATGAAAASGAVRLPLDEVGDVDVTLPIPIEKTQGSATLRLRARVRESGP